MDDESYDGKIKDLVTKFIDSLDTDYLGSRHIVLFCEEPEYALSIELRFLKNGLLKGQPGIYIVNEDGLKNSTDDIDFIENQMIDYGIDVAKFKKNNLLKIVSAPNAIDHPEGELKGAEEICRSLFSVDNNYNNDIDIKDEKQRPIRVVGRIMSQVKTEVEIQANINIERWCASTIIPANNIFLICHYPVDKIVQHLKGYWMQALLTHHHAVIYFPKLSNGIAMNLVS